MTNVLKKQHPKERKVANFVFVTPRIWTASSRNNKSVNDSFHAQIYNRLGSTVRGPYDGGVIEYNKAARFRKTAEELQIMYPITSEIFRDLSGVYMKEAKRHDTEVEIMKLDN